MTKIQIQGYSFCGRSRINGKGGVGILVRNDVMSHVTPHDSQRELELMWISVRRKNQNPLYIGVYYGKQETGVTKEEIETEFGELTQEILEIKQYGDVIICMDANAKIGILGEPISRNGQCLLNMTEEASLTIMNLSEICSGKVTRVNRKKPTEKSAIDFVLACSESEPLIEEVQIDEEGSYVMKNDKAESDHNSILIRLNLENIDHQKNVVKTVWKTTASEEQLDAFYLALRGFNAESSQIMADHTIPIDIRYNQWYNEIERIAGSTIGKKSIKTKKPEKFSELVTEMRMEKRRLKKLILSEKDINIKNDLKQQYIAKQRETRNQIEQERAERIREKFSLMIQDKSCAQFWNNVRNGNRDPPSSWISIKDHNGKRLIDPNGIKERVANYYTELFAKQKIPHHPYHNEVEQAIKMYATDFSYDHLDYNECPTLAEIKMAIKNKKNGKSTTDLPNEIIKLGEEEMAKLIHHVVKAFWDGELVPSLWNEGLISSVWKGKGDKEKMEYQRGITVSSTISMIPEEIIHNRMRNIIKLSPAQGGGKKGSATRDHLFLLRAAMSTAIKDKRPLYITFYDVQKAYDHADPHDMLYIAWNAGLKGKLWRLTKLLNTNLTARINTRYGKTDKIEREIGGKQGGKIMTFLFAKLMDTLAEDLERAADLGISINNINLSALEWVDDVISFAESHNQQLRTLEFIDEFATKHKLKWGPEKCKVMEVGKNNNNETKWNLGEETITSTNEYTYLGDIITPDGKNDKNIENRKIRMQRTTRRVLASSQIEVMKRIETKTLLRLHEAYTIPSILINCESWTLSKKDRNSLDKMEIWAFKKLLGLPITTPTAAVMYESRAPYTSIRVINRQLKYLHTILAREDEDLGKKTLLSQVSEKSGWGKYIVTTLHECGIELNLDEIRGKKKVEWRAIVDKATWQLNRKKILDSCKGKEKLKTKTLEVAKSLENDSTENSENVLFDLPRHCVKTIIMARYGMLDCANNYKGKYGTKLCATCKTIDDENHRINHCIRWKDVNLYGDKYEIDFNAVYTHDKDTLRQISSLLQCIWNLENNKNETRQ